MAYNNGGFNTGYVGNNEIFSHVRTPMHFRPDVEEIVQPRVNEAYGHNNHGYNIRGYNGHGYNNQVPQMYYNDDHHNDGRRDYDHNDRYNRGNCVPEHIPYPMDQEELREISVRIKLSITRNIESVRTTLWRNHALSCSIDGDVLTVSGAVPSSRVLYGQNEFLNIIRRVSGDSRAFIVRPRRD